MVVEYDLLRRDVLAFALGHYLRQPLIWLALGILWAFVAWSTYSVLPVDASDIAAVAFAAALSAGLATLAAQKRPSAGT